MKCINCDKEAAGRSKYCGNSCKVLYNRKQPAVKSVNVNSVRETVNKPPEVIDGKYNREYLPGGQYYVGCCYEDGDGNWQVKNTTQHTSCTRTSDRQVQAIWDRRNAQGQPAAYSEPLRPIPEAR